MDISNEPEQTKGVGDARWKITATKTCPLPEEVLARFLVVQRRSRSLGAPPIRQNCECGPLLPPVDHRGGEVVPTLRKNDVDILAMPPSRQRGTPLSEGNQGNPPSQWVPGLSPSSPFPWPCPSDFYLFRSLQGFLRDKTLETEEEVKSALDDFFAS